MVRVRFAPSPSGYLHIGSARTALFNYLFARHHKGTFIIRIEDTDQKRSRDEFLHSILNDLNWLGLNWDEEPYSQSQRLKIYQEYGQKLVKENKASYAEEESSAIIFKMPRQKIKIEDLIHKDIEFDTTFLADQVIMKADGTPTYNFACVVDDALMGITHIIRGDDHISNTPKQIALYQALGFTPPYFAHIPLIMGEDKSRLSKRHGATSISEFKETGFLPEAMVNYLALLGWSPGGNQEIFSLGEAVNKFNLKAVNNTQAVFDLKKLTWINHQHIKKYDSLKLLNIIKPQLSQKKYLPKAYDQDWLLRVVKLFQSRLNLTQDFITQADFVFLDKIDYDQQAFRQLFLKDKNKSSHILKEVITLLEPASSFEATYLEQLCRGLAAKLDIKSAELIHPLRLALTGKTVSPGLFEVMSVLGKEKVLQRLRQALRSI